MDDDGMLEDVQVQSIDDPDPPKREDRTQDVLEFFGPVYTVQTGPGNKLKTYRDCMLCK